MRVSVEYYDGEPREALTLHREEWGIISFPKKRMAPSREGSAADRLVKSMKKEAAQDNLNHARLGDEEAVKHTAIQIPWGHASRGW